MLYHRLPEHGACVVHAGVPGDWATLPRLDKLALARRLVGEIARRLA